MALRHVVVISAVTCVVVTEGRTRGGNGVSEGRMQRYLDRCPVNGSGVDLHGGGVGVGGGGESM